VLPLRQQAAEQVVEVVVAVVEEAVVEARPGVGAATTTAASRLEGPPAEGAAAVAVAEGVVVLAVQEVLEVLGVVVAENMLPQAVVEEDTVVAAGLARHHVHQVPQHRDRERQEVVALHESACAPCRLQIADEMSSRRNVLE
jgi:hypothetical protein